MTDPETQLRLILKAHATDSEPLLDEVLADRDHHQGRAEYLSGVARAAERSLSALREAVGPALERRGVLARSYPWLGPVFDAMEAALAAHDAAPAAPTLTLEEVGNVVGAVVGWAYANGKEGADDGALEVGRRLQALLEQKGAAPAAALTLEEATLRPRDKALEDAARLVECSGRDKTCSPLEPCAWCRTAEKIRAQKGVGRGK